MNMPAAAHNNEAKPAAHGDILRKILVVVDPTVHAPPCIEKARFIADRFGSEIELLVCDFEQTMPVDLDGVMTVPEYRHLLGSRRLAGLERHAASLRESGLRVTTTAQWSADFVGGIGRHVIRTAPDLVIKDTHHHFPMPRTMGIRTDWNLLRQLPAPLLLVRERRWHDVPRLGVCVDPTRPADRAVELDRALIAFGRGLTEGLSGILDVIHVLREPPHLPDETVSEAERIDAHSQARRSVEEIVGNDGLYTSLHFEEGAVVERLVAVAAHLESDVLAMGVAARVHWTDTIPGGTAAQILETLECDLLAVKQPGFVSPLLVAAE